VQIILLDMFNCAYACYYGFTGRDKDGKSRLETDDITATMFGVLKTVIAAIEANPHTGMVVAAFDHSNGPTWRHELFPAYKANRKVFKDARDEQVKTQARTIVGCVIEQLLAMFSNLPVFTAIRENTEADDLIASMVHHYAKAGFYITVVSGDKDMRQLLVNDNITIQPTTGKSMKLTRYDFSKMCKVKTTGKVPEVIRIPTPEAWLAFRVLSGDSSDNISNVDGIGEVKAARLVVNAHERPLPGAKNVLSRVYVADEALVEGIRGAKGLLEKLQSDKARNQMALNTALMCIGEDSFAVQNVGSPAAWMSRGVFAREWFLNWLTWTRMSTVIQKFDLFDSLDLRMKQII